VYSKLSSSSIAKHISEARFGASSLWTTLHVDSRTKRVALCKQYDVSDTASSARPAEWKYQPFPTKWSVIDAKVRVCSTVHPKSKSTTDDIIQQMIAVQCEVIKNAVVMIDGSIRPMTEILDNDKSSAPNAKHKDKKGKSKSSASTQPASKWAKTFQCSVFLPLENDVETDTASTISCDEKDVSVCIEGVLDIHAYLPVKTTVQDAITMLKASIIQDFYQRCQLLKEDLADQGGRGLTKGGVFPMPKKVLFMDPADGADDGFLWSQFMFPEESLEDLIEIIKDSCKFTVGKDDIQRDREQFSEVLDEDSMHTDACNPPKPDAAEDEKSPPAVRTAAAAKQGPLLDKSNRFVTVTVGALAFVVAWFYNMYISTAAGNESQQNSGS